MAKQNNAPRTLKRRPVVGVDAELEAKIQATIGKVYERTGIRPTRAQVVKLALSRLKV